MTLSSIKLPCGSTAIWDSPSDMGYRCTSCYAMVGSIGQPKSCVDEANLYKMMEVLGAKGWDYATGKVKE